MNPSQSQRGAAPRPGSDAYYRQELLEGRRDQSFGGESSSGRRVLESYANGNAGRRGTTGPLLGSLPVSDDVLSLLGNPLSSTPRFIGSNFCTASALRGPLHPGSPMLSVASSLAATNVSSQLHSLLASADTGLIPSQLNTHMSLLPARQINADAQRLRMLQLQASIEENRAMQQRIELERLLMIERVLNDSRVPFSQPTIPIVPTETVTETTSFPNQTQLPPQSSEPVDNAVARVPDESAASHGSSDVAQVPQKTPARVSAATVPCTKKEKRWMDRFEELLAFKKRYGHCRVPHGYLPNKGLSWWVMNQRAQYNALKRGKESWLTQERVKMLDEAGFDWNRCAGKTKSKVKGRAKVEHGNGRGDGRQSSSEH